MVPLHRGSLEHPSPAPRFVQRHATCRRTVATWPSTKPDASWRSEETIRGKPPYERRAHRREDAQPLVDQFHGRLTTTLETLSRESDTSGAMPYALKRWDAPTHYCVDGQREIDKLQVERALRGVKTKHKHPVISAKSFGSTCSIG
jgi:transposase